MKSTNQTQAKQNNVWLMTISFFLAIAFAICIAVLALYEVSNHQAELYDSYGAQQLLLAKSVAEKVSPALEKTSDKAVLDVLNQAETNGSRFWLLADNTSILFYKNEKETSDYSQKNIHDLVKDYSIQGGYQSRKLYNALEQKQDCSLSYSEGSGEKKKLISLHFFSVKDKDYVLGISTTEKYINTSFNLVHHNVYFLIFCGIPLVLLIIAVLFLTLRTSHNNKKMQEYEKMLRDKNRTIETLSKSVSNYEQKQSKPNVYDNLTGVLYNLDFIHAFLRKATNPALFPLSVVVIHVGDRSYCEDSVLLRVANAIRTSVAQKDIVAREGQDFILLFVQKDQDALLDCLKIILMRLEAEFPKYPIRVGVSHKHTLDFNVEHMIEHAYENLQKDTKEANEPMNSFDNAPIN